MKKQNSISDKKILLKEINAAETDKEKW